MSKNQKNFFKTIKPWAEYKNFILDYYLTPYFSKVKFLKKPILLVDCCSGPGVFEDDTKGSPLIIAEHLRKNNENGVECKGIFIEKDKKWAEQLKANLQSYSSFCEIKNGDFKKFWQEICNQTSTHTVFVYVDPFGVEDLIFDNFQALLSAISVSTSIELLLNWNSIGFLRWGIAALKGKQEAITIYKNIDSRYIEDIEEVDFGDIEQLNKIANGDYWQSIIQGRKQICLQDCEKEMTGNYLEQFPNTLFKGNYAITPKYGAIPKYHLIFITRNHEALFLMNDTMAKARRNSLKKEFIDDLLFDLTPDEIKKEKELLKSVILDNIKLNPDTLFKPNIKCKIINTSGMFAKFEDKDFTETLRTLRMEKKINPNKGKAILPVKYKLN